MAWRRLRRISQGLATHAALPVLCDLAPSNPRLAGAMAGLLAGGITAALYTIHSPESSPLFIAVWHIPAVVRTLWRPGRRPSIALVIGHFFARSTVTFSDGARIGMRNLPTERQHMARAAIIVLAASPLLTGRLSVHGPAAAIL